MATPEQCKARRERLKADRAIAKGDIEQIENPKRRARKPGTTPNKPPRALNPAKQAEMDAINAEYEKTHPTKKTRAATKFPQSPAKKKKAKKRVKAIPATRAPREPKTDGPGAKIFELIRRPQGAGITELMSATGWQAHSVRGFLSTATMKRGMPITREHVTTNGDGVGRVSTIYHMASE